MRNIWEKIKKIPAYCNSYINRAMLMLTALCVSLMLITSSYMAGQMHNTLLQSEISAQELVLGSLNEFLTEQSRTVRSIVEQIYIDSLSQQSAYTLLSTTFSSATDPDYIASKAAFDVYTKSALTQNQDLLSLCAYKLADDRCFGNFNMNFTFYILNNASDRLADYVDLSDTVRHYEIRPRLNAASEQLESIFRSRYMNLSGGTSYVISMPLVRLTDYSTTIGALLAEFSIQDFEETLKNYSASEYGSIMIFESGGDLVYSSSAIALPEGFSLSDLPEDWARHAIGAMDAYVKCLYNKDLDAYSVSILPLHSLMASADRMKSQIWSICCVAVLSCLALSFLLTRRVFRRIHQITGTMAKMRDKNFQLRLPVTGTGDELDEISISFNKMCVSLEEYVEKIYASQLRQKQLEISQQAAEIQALQAQIQPHFLYNTLETIRMKAILDGSWEAGEMVRILAELLKRQIRANTVVSADDEARFCDLFLRLFQYRHQNRLEYEIDVAPEARGTGMMKNSLQPLLENYLIHGYRADMDTNRVCIRGSITQTDDGPVLRFEIADNGRGIESGRLAALQSALRQGCEESEDSGIGLRNVNRRIRMVFGLEYGCSLESVEGEGTIVRLVMPAMTEKELGERVHCNAD